MAYKLFVGGLSWDTTDASLNAFFAQAGTVVSASVITDRATGRSRGFGFVEMETAEGAEKAKALSGQMLDGRTIVVNDARPQERRDGGNFSRGGFDRNRGGGDRGGRPQRDY